MEQAVFSLTAFGSPLTKSRSCWPGPNPFDQGPLRPSALFCLFFMGAWGLGLGSPYEGLGFRSLGFRGLGSRVHGLGGL